MSAHVCLYQSMSGCDGKPISILETGTRTSFLQSHVRDEKPISILETGTRISFFQSHVRDENENLFSLNLVL